jgi:predicted RNA binding protein YcfA (HicA-like mRNA interferase family)
MPKLRRLSGKQVIAILRRFGFEVIRIRGSHHQLQRVADDQEQLITVPVHRNEPLPIGTLRSIYRQACLYIPETDLYPLFYAD